MKIIVTFLLVTFSFSLYAQTAYDKAMTNSLELLETDLQAAAQQFERIATVAKENWLPSYYAALAHVNSSWGQSPKEQTLLYMKKAQEFIDKAETISPNNPEIMVLQGMLNNCYIKYDSSVYGMKLSGPTTAIYEKAIAMAPKNPRVVSNRAQWLMGSAQFFGKDVTPYCGELEKAILLFDAEQPEDFKPKWGKEGALKAQQGCK